MAVRGSPCVPFDTSSASSKLRTSGSSGWQWQSAHCAPSIRCLTAVSSAQYAVVGSLPEVAVHSAFTAAGHMQLPHSRVMKSRDGRLHWCAGVHSRYDQLKQFIDGSVKQGAKRIRVHILTDGRDVPDGSSIGFVEQLEKDLKEACAVGCDAKIASGGGRMGVTMDRYEVQQTCY